MRRQKFKRGFKNFRFNTNLNRNKNRVFKSLVSFILIFTMFIGYVPYYVYGADGDNLSNFKWHSDSYMDQGFYERKADNNTDILLSWDCDIKDTSHYELSFFTPDSVLATNYNQMQNTNFPVQDAVTKHVLTIDLTSENANFKLNYKHETFIYDNGGNLVDATFAYLQGFSEFDFGNNTWKGNDTGQINYEILANSSNRGYVYRLNAQEFRIYWDTSDDDSVKSKFKIDLYQLMGVSNSNIYDFTLHTANGNDSIEVVKNVKFTSKPTRWGITNTSSSTPGVTTDPAVIATLDKTLVRPGLEFTVGSLKKYDDTTKKFKTISDTSDTFQNIKIVYNISGIGDDAAEVDQISLDLKDMKKDSNGDYKLDIIGYDAGQVDWYHNIFKTSDDSHYYFIRKNIYDSHVYKVKMDIAINNNPTIVNRNAYTYTEFRIERKNIKETYVVFKPYKINGTYTIYANTNKASNLFVPVNEYARTTLQNEFPDEVYVPIDIQRTGSSEANNNYIGIDFVEATDTSNVVQSEILEYDSNKDEDVAVDVPSNMKVHDVTVIGTEDNVEVAQFYLSFKVPEGLRDKSILKNSSEKIWYEVMLNDTQVDTDGHNYAIADIIYLERLGDDRVKVTTENMNQIDPTYCVYLDSTSKTIDVKIALKPIVNDGFTNKTYMDKIEGFFSYYKQDTSDSTKYNMQDPQATGVQPPNNYYDTTLNGVRIPGGGKNYFVTLRGLYKRGTHDPKESSLGVPVNVVLSENEEIIPIPGNLQFNDILDQNLPANLDKMTEIAVKIDPVDITNYDIRMLDPVQAKVDGNIQYEVFFADSQEKLNAFLSYDDIKLEKSVKDDYDSNPNKIYGDLVKQVRIDHVINKAADPKDYAVIKVGNSSDDDINISLLRGKNVYAFVTESTKLDFKGLDANSNYYIAVRTIVNIEDRKGVKSTKYSEISKIYYTITGTKPIMPVENEKVPPTPISFSVIEGPTDTSVKVRWQDPLMTKENGFTYGYELVRVADERIKGDDRSNTISIKELKNRNLIEFNGYRIVENTNDQNDLKVLDANGNFVEPESNNAFYAYIPDGELGEERHFTDSTLKPNRIYYYYIRRIKIKNDDQDEILYSEWSELTTTTIPVQGIKNLREVEPTLAESMYHIKDFDPYYERIIAFEGPFDEQTVTGYYENQLKKLPESLSFNISIKDTLETEYFEAKSANCAILDFDEKYKTYVFKIQQLESGTRYNVRVAVVDLSITDKYGQNPMSSFCDPISLRTEFKQEDYDKKTKYEEYETYYDYILGKIPNELTFTLEDDYKNYSVKFKEDKMQGEIGKTRESTYLLPTTDANNYTYYLSANNINQLVKLKKGLRIEHDGVTIIIPYSFLNKEYQQVYADRIKNVEDIKDKVEDFYLKIWAGFTDPQAYIDGQRTSGKQVQLAMKFIEQSTMNMDIDVLLEDKIRDYIESNKLDFFDKIERELEGQINDQLFLQYVDDEVESIRKYIMDMAATELSNYELETYSFNNVYDNINVRYKTNDISSKIYIKPNNSLKWQPITTSNSGGYASGYIKDLGLMVLTSMSNQQIEYGRDEDKNAFYTRYKYDLDNILIRNGALDTKNGGVSQDLFRDIAFQILSYDTSNVFNLAKQKQNLDNKFVFYNDPLTKQELVYGVLTVYDEFTGVNLNKVVIDNAKQAISYNYKPYYKQSILAGYQLGIVGLSDVSNPTGKMSVDELLDLIYRVFEE